MMCYRDMTFCDGAEGTCAHFGTCNRALTDNVKESAKKANMPVMSFRSPHLLECYEPKQKEIK